MSIHPSTHRFSVQPLASLASLAAVREAFVEWLSGVAMADEKIEDLQVVISELGANAVRATPEGAPPATVAAWIEDRCLTLEVANHLDDAVAPTTDWDLDDPLRPGGRGLLLVSAFVDDVHVDVEDDLLLVRCVTMFD